MMLSRKIAKRSIKTLQRRQDYLIDRINLSDVDLSFDKSESAALGVSIKIIEALIKGQKVEVSHGRSINRIGSSEARDHQTNNQSAEAELLSGTTHTG